ncbi:MAG: DNA-deoxyinosine glycosylase [Methylocystis sp.]|uniref:DNA-deoxyinosine glycosylase n=1 Tax=Methylocystis sp. TaxID=1911079 RepID=UPI003DA32CF6
MVKSVGLPMIARQDARVLILGTLPGVAALRLQQYYAHQQNCFWKIMGEVIGFSPDLPYETRLGTLQSNRIAVWNVLAEAERYGSVDANIKAPVPNSFVPFFREHREIRAVCFNGQEAERLFRRFVMPSLTQQAASLPRSVLPSTSPANARIRFGEKLSRWRKVLSHIGER